MKTVGASVASSGKVYYRSTAKKAFQSHDLTSIRKQKFQSLSLFYVDAAVVVAAVAVATAAVVVVKMNIKICVEAKLILQYFLFFRYFEWICSL